MKQGNRYWVAGLVAIIAALAVFMLWPSTTTEAPIVLEPIIAPVSLEPVIPTDREAIVQEAGNLKMITGIECDLLAGELNLGLKNPTEDVSFLLRPLTREERVYGTREESGLKLLLNGRAIKQLSEKCDVDADHVLAPGDSVRCEVPIVPNDNRQEVILRSGVSNNKNVFNVKTVGLTERIVFTC